MRPQNPSIISSAGAIGKQFNPDGAIGQIGEKVGGPFSKDGAIGSQFDASKDGIAGHVERAVDGPSNPAGSAKKREVKDLEKKGARGVVTKVSRAWVAVAIDEGKEEVAFTGRVWAVKLADEVTYKRYLNSFLTRH